VTKRRGNNEGSIFARDDGTWRAMVSINGRRLSKSFKTQRECREWLKQTLAQVEDGLTIQGAQTTLVAYLEYWLETAKETVRPKTFLQYQQIARQYIVPELGKIKLKDLQPDHVQALYTRLLKAGTGVRTVRLAHAVLHRALARALRWGLVRRNVCDAVDKPKAHPVEMKTLSVEQAQAFLAAADGHRLEALFHLAVHSGLRQGELLGLRWSDLEWQTGELQVQRQVQRLPGQAFVFSEPKTAAGRRSITLDPNTLLVLRAHSKRQKEERLHTGARWQEQGLMFPSTVGTPLDQRNVLREFHAVLTKAGLPQIRFHDLRHTAATLLLQLGTHPKVVQAILGHSSISVTMDTYCHVGTTLQRDAMQRVAELLNVADTQTAPELHQIAAKKATASGGGR
jgi:integrase